MKFYITKITFNTEDGALPIIEGDLSTEVKDSLLNDSAIRMMVEEFKEKFSKIAQEQAKKALETWSDAIKDDIIEDIYEDLDYRQIGREVVDYIDFNDYIDEEDIADNVHDLIDYDDIVNRVIEEIKERL